MNRIKSAIRKLHRLVIEMRLSYYWRCLGNINKLMALVKRRIDGSEGTLRVWASEDSLELAEDRIMVKEKIKRLQRQLNKI